MTKQIIFGVGPSFLDRDHLTEGVVAPWEDGLRTDTTSNCFEWWYFDAHFEDGSTAVIVFSTKPMLERNGPLKPGVQFTITRPNGQKLSCFPVFPINQFSASKETCDIRIGNNRVHGDLHHYELHAAFQDMAADLTFTGSLPPWRPGNGKNYYDPSLSRYFAWLPAIPFGTVSGTLTYDGHIHTVSGTSYHDHNWGNVGLNDVMSQWVWGRARVGEYSLIFVEMNTTQEYGGQKIPVFLVAKGDQILTGDGSPLKLTTGDMVTHPGRRQYPRELDFNWQGIEGTVHLQLRQPELIEAVSLLTMFPPLKRRLLRLFANPYYFRFNATLELRINLKNIQTVEQGRALYEIMLLR